MIPTTPPVQSTTQQHAQNQVRTSFVLKSLTVLLGIFFIFIGAMKLTPQISKELHRDLRREYVKYSKAFPLSTLLDFKIPSKWYRRIVGVLEVTSGLAMAFIPNYKIKNAANMILLTLMLLAVYSHFMVSDPFERCGPALVFTFMLSGRFVVWYQMDRRNAAIEALNQAQLNGMKQD